MYTCGRYKKLIKLYLSALSQWHSTNKALCKENRLKIPIAKSVNGTGGEKNVNTWPDYRLLLLKLEKRDTQDRNNTQFSSLRKTCPPKIHSDEATMFIMYVALCNASTKFRRQKEKEKTTTQIWYYNREIGKPVLLAENWIFHNSLYKHNIEISSWKRLCRNLLVSQYSKKQP